MFGIVINLFMLIIDPTNISLSTYYALDTILGTKDTAGTKQI